MQKQLELAENAAEWAPTDRERNQALNKVKHFKRAIGEYQEQHAKEQREASYAKDNRVKLMRDFASTLSPATIPLYERLGWKPWLGPLLERMPDGTVVATPDEEMVMVYEPPGRPPVDRRQPLSVEWRVGEVW